MQQYVILNVPLKEKEIEKVYYTIGEVAAIFSVNASLIRFWEKEFDIIKPKKNKKGNRLFTKEDIQNFEKIFELVKKQGYTLEGAKQKLKHRIANTNQNQHIYEKLENLKKQLLAIRDSF